MVTREKDWRISILPNGDYAAFGKVTEGIEAADKIVSVERNAADKPLVPQVIKSVIIEK